MSKNKHYIKGEKEFDTVKFFREVKEKIASEISDMNFEEIKEYFKVRSEEFRAKQKALNTSL